MKQGRTITELATELTRQLDTKRDFLATTDQLTARVDGGAVVMGMGNHEPLRIKSTAHDQIGSFLEIPSKYYNTMLSEVPELLTENINTWFSRKVARRMVRTLDGGMRAFLSDRYRSLDNYDLFEAVYPVLMDEGLMIMSCEVTDKRLYIKAVDQRIERDVPTGRRMGDGSHVFFDTVSPACVVTNSEIGFGAVNVEVGTYTKVCTNLAMFSERGMRKYHIGRSTEMLQGITGVQAYLSDETKQATDKALWMQVRDVLRGAFDEERFSAFAEKLGGAAQDRIVGAPDKVVEVFAARNALNATTRGSIMRHLIEGADLTRYGLMNAVTRASQDHDDYEQATSLEKLGGAVFEMPAGEWKTLAAVGA